jgi:four helix bundle protein
MKTENVIVEKTYAFSLRIIEMVKILREKREFDLSSQLWRAGTSIGANVEEAQAAQSRADFRSKMSIAAKEARETHYWLRLTLDAKVIPFSQLERLIDDIQEIKRLLTAIVKSATD